MAYVLQPLSFPGLGNPSQWGNKRSKVNAFFWINKSLHQVKKINKRDPFFVADLEADPCMPASLSLRENILKIWVFIFSSGQRNKPRDPRSLTQVSSLKVVTARSQP